MLVFILLRYFLGKEFGDHGKNQCAGRHDADDARTWFFGLPKELVRRWHRGRDGDRDGLETFYALVQPWYYLLEWR